MARKENGYSNTFRLAKKQRKREEAEVRNEAWRQLSPQEQLAELDKRFGKGKGATKQRKRLAKNGKEKEI